MSDAFAPTPPRATANPLARLAADAALLVAILAALQAFRLVLLLVFRAEMDPASTADHVARCFAVGARFDVQIASCAVAPRAFLSIVGLFVRLPRFLDRLRAFHADALAVLGALVFVIDVGFFAEYHDQFNHWIFGLVFDDRAAIFATIWHSYPVVWITILTALLAAALVVAARAALRAATRRTGDAPPPRAATRAAFALVAVVALFAGVRASLGSRPLQAKDAAVTSDPFLDRLVMNPFSALSNAVDEYRVSTLAKGIERFFPEREARRAASAWFGSSAPVTDIDDATRRTAAGSAAKKPTHVILVVLESYDAWGLRPENAALAATTRLAALGRDGIAADAFVSAGDGTMPSLAALMTGIPETGVKVNYQAGIRGGVPTGTADTFRRLGYRPRFHYGGYPSWQRLGEFAKEQGFDEIHGGGDMSATLSGNEWGVDDDDLYRYVESRLGDTPTFDMLMTTSYHPPYTVDLDAAGFSIEPIKAELAARKFTDEETKILGHLWYADRALGDFVAAVLAKHPDTLVAVTGDHWSRRAFSSRPILFGQRAVPFVLYGPSVLAGVPRPPKIAGSHVDIVPTLVELVAPAGFAYHAFGRNLLDPALPQIGYGNETILTPDLIVDAAPRGRAEDMAGRRVALGAEIEAMRESYRRLHGLAWWRVMRGSRL